MKETTYLPDPRCAPRIASHGNAKGWRYSAAAWCMTRRRATWEAMAGHAGVFSTADDLAKEFCQMLLDGGDGLFSPVNDPQVYNRSHSR